jgi:hypothetical protein
MVMRDGWVVELRAFLLNRSIAAMTLMFWPAVALIGLVAASRRQRGALLSGLLPLVAAIFGSQHGTSKVAFIGAAAVFGLFQFSSALAKRIVTIGWVATWIMVVPAAILAYRGELYLAGWLPHSAQHRVVIWGLTSREIAKAPVLGAGIHAARAVNDPYSYDAPVVPGTNIRESLGMHSHNVYLQTWYEAGGVGVFLLLATGLLALRSLNRAPPFAQPYFYAWFASCALLGASSFSLWQPWFMASIGFAAVFAMLGYVLADRRPLKPAGEAQPLTS